MKAIEKILIPALIIIGFFILIIIGVKVFALSRNVDSISQVVVRPDVDKIIIDNNNE